MEYAKEVYTSFVNLEKTCDRIARDKLWAVLFEYDMKSQLLAAIELLYKDSEVCVRVNGIKTKSFCACVGLRQGFFFSSSVYYIHGQDRQRQFLQ